MEPTLKGVSVGADDDPRDPASHRQSDLPRVSVVIVTWLRPDHVRSCLEHLGRTEPSPQQVAVVDASEDDRTATVTKRFAWAQRVPFPGGAGHMTTARNVGLLHTNGDVIAFLDDDANVRPGWVQGLLDAFIDPTVGAVAGRTCNGVPGEETEGVDVIGRVLMNGELSGYFAADPACSIQVDHGIGANMAFRREALARLGGFRDDFRGVGGVREDTDMFLRLRALGYRAVFSRDAIADHTGAPHVKGRRFDYRYQFWARRNHVLLLARNYGLGSVQLRAWITNEMLHAYVHRSPEQAGVLRTAARAVLTVVAVSAGVASSLGKARWRASDPLRRDKVGAEIRQHLSSTSG
jgi:GT2 family glycosyltransferase